MFSMQLCLDRGYVMSYVTRVYVQPYDARSLTMNANEHSYRVQCICFSLLSRGYGRFCKIRKDSFTLT